MSKSDPSNPDSAHPQPRGTPRPAPRREPISDELDRLQTRLSELEHLLDHQSRLATIGTIAGLIAHEFNNILTPVLTYAQMALARPEDAALARRALERAAEGSERAAKVATAILGFVRDDHSAVSVPQTELAAQTQCSTWNIPAPAPAAGTPPPSGGSPLGVSAQPKSADVRISLERALACIGRDLVKDGIELNVLVEEGVAAEIEPVSLEHILLNLILNARNAMLPVSRGHGRLAVRALVCARPPSPPEGAVKSGGDTLPLTKQEPPNIHTKTNQIERRAALRSGDGAEPGATTSHAACPDAWLVLEIEDSGRGMTPERLAKLFTPFLTAPGAQPRAGYTGTGLGMTLCKRMVEQARGEMHAWSARGKGTCIRVILPAA